MENNNTDSGIQFYTLGTPRIIRDGLHLEMDTRKATALLAYLAITGKPHTRDHLTYLCWPDFDQANARGALRRTLSTIRKALGEMVLDTTREMVGIAEGAPLWVDAVEFRDALSCAKSKQLGPHPIPAECAGFLQAAVDLYQGDFLTGFSLRDSPTFDEWQYFQNESLRQDLSIALEQLVFWLRKSGDIPKATAYARRWLQLDPLREEAHRLLIQLYAQSGQRNQALQQYRECVRILDRELGVSPLEETTQLYQSILEQPAGSIIPENPPPDTPPVPGKMAGRVFSSIRESAYPLVGRTEAFNGIQAAYQEIASSGRLVTIEGEAGIGKTRLIEEFIASVEAPNARVINVRFFEGENNLAYGSISESLQKIIGLPEIQEQIARLPTHWQSELRRLLPELTALHPGIPDPVSFEGLGAQSHFFEGIRQALFAVLSGLPPGILVLDDVQWIDSASLELLSYVIKRISDWPVLLLFTWRTEETPTSHRLQQIVDQAHRAGFGVEIRLERFTLPQIRQLAQALPGATEKNIPADLPERLYRETDGLPFFIVEYLEKVHRDILSGAPIQWDIPSSVKGLLRSRLANVDETGSQILAAAAVIGRAFDLTTIRDVSGRSETEIVNGLDDLIKQGLIIENPPDDFTHDLIFRFTYEKLYELIYEEISMVRKRLLHRRTAEALANRSKHLRDPGSQAAQIGLHYRHAGQDLTAANYYKDAGDYARKVYANLDALNHYQTSLALGYPETANLHEAIGDLYALSGDYAEGLKHYEAAAAVNQAARLGQLEYKMGGIHQIRGEWDLAESHFQAAHQALTKSGDLDILVRLDADWSRMLHQRGASDQSVVLAYQAFHLAENTGAPAALAQAHNVLGILARQKEDYDQAVEHLEKSVALSSSLDDPGARIASLNNLALVYAACGKYDRALDLAGAALELCIQRGDRHHEAALQNHLADYYHALGDQVNAMSHLEKAVRIFAEIGIEAGSVQTEIWRLTEW